MKISSKIIISALAICCLAGCGKTGGSAAGELTALSSDKWPYNEQDDVYYQLGDSYCASPVDPSYESLAFFVPGAYFSGTKNSGDRVDRHAGEYAGLYGPGAAYRVFFLH